MMFVIYRIYYGNKIVYIGRTIQPLQQRLYNHFHKKPKVREIDIALVTKIEFAELETQADMNCYEVYLINMIKPKLNKLDKTKDNLTIELPELKWQQFFSHLIEKWRNEISFKDREYKKKIEEKQKMIEFGRNQRKLMRETLTHDEYLEWLDNVSGAINNKLDNKEWDYQ